MNKNMEFGQNVLAKKTIMENGEIYTELYTGVKIQGEFLLLIFYYTPYTICL